MARLLNLLSVFVAIGGMLYRAVVFKSLWRWFVAPAIHLTPVSFWTSFGLLLFIGICSKTERSDDASEETEEEQAIKRLSRLIIILLSWTIALWLGWLIAGGHHHGA